MEKKFCMTCGKEFIKPYKESKKDWSIRKYCSRQCTYLGRSIITPIEIERRRKQTLSMLGNNWGFQKGEQAWNKGLKGKIIPWNKGKKTGIVSKSVFKKGMIPWNKGTGEDGIVDINHILRNNSEYFAWRIAVYKRDWFTCQDCGNKKDGLVAHHVFSFKDFPSLRYEVANGITLCRSCHKKRHYNIGKETRFKKKEINICLA